MTTHILSQTFRLWVSDILGIGSCRPYTPRRCFGFLAEIGDMLSTICIFTDVMHYISGDAVQWICRLETKVCLWPVTLTGRQVLAGDTCKSSIAFKLQRES